MTKETKRFTLRFRAANRDIFQAIRSGKKKVETRAATSRYRDIARGDTLTLVCGKNRFERKAKRVKIFKSITALLKTYRIKDINPKVSSSADLESLYMSFPPTIAKR